MYQKNIEWKRKIDEKKQHIKKLQDEQRDTQNTFHPNLDQGKKQKSRALFSGSGDWRKKMDEKKDELIML